ncbi:MAG: hypothetical protein ACK4Q5_17950 [Saprospiraceae bacterium]
MNRLLPLLLFFAQAYLIQRGSHHFSKWWNPVLLLAVTVGIAWMYGRFLLNVNELKENSTSPARRWQGALLGAAGIGLCYEELRKLFVRFSPPVKWSDVVPQLEAQFDRWARGEMPYQPVHFETYDAYPVYMPMNWLPIGISRFFGMDARWSGYVVLLLAVGLVGWHLWQRGKATWQTVAAVLLPSVALWSFILWKDLEIPVSYELLIAAYYLVLVAGLMSGSTTWMLAGVILCLLSRYTLVFWLPLFALVLFHERPLRWNLWFWAAVTTAIVCIYIVPFVQHDPTILEKGVGYHNGAAIEEWKGVGDPPVSWTMEKGISFALHLKTLFTGDMAHRVMLARVVQASVMLALFALGWLGYRRWRGRIPAGEFLLLMLYCVISGFYFFGPLTYRYYLIVLLMISAVICGRMMTKTTAQNISET